MKSGNPLARAAMALLAAGIAFSAAAAEPPAALEAYRGKVTYVDFWASWCGPCAESFPWLNAMHAKYGAQGLQVVGVGVDNREANGDRFLKMHPAQFAILRDAKGEIAQHYAVEGMPYSVLLGPDGQILHRHTGFRASETAEYERAIEAALNAQGKGKL